MISLSRKLHSNNQICPDCIMRALSENVSYTISENKNMIDFIESVNLSINNINVIKR